MSVNKEEIYWCMQCDAYMTHEAAQSHNCVLDLVKERCVKIVNEMPDATYFMDDYERLRAWREQTIAKIRAIK